MGEELSFKIRFLFIIHLIGMPSVSPSGGRIKEGGILSKKMPKKRYLGISNNIK
jgi:hypothetical protein